jgi:hypothetical protein
MGYAASAFRFASILITLEPPLEVARLIELFVKIDPPAFAVIPTVAEPKRFRAPAFICPQLSKFVLLKLLGPLLLIPVRKLGLVPLKLPPLVTVIVCVVVAPLTVIDDTKRFGLSTGKMTDPAVIVETFIVL